MKTTNQRRDKGAFVRCVGGSLLLLLSSSRKLLRDQLAAAAAATIYSLGIDV